LVNLERLTPQNIFGFCRSSNVEFQDNGICCYCKTSTLKILEDAGISEQDLIYVSSKQNYHEFSFCIFTDHTSKSIVISIFGSLSIANMVTYMDAVPVPLDIHGMPATFMVMQFLAY